MRLHPYYSQNQAKPFSVMNKAWKRHFREIDSTACNNRATEK